MLNLNAILQVLTMVLLALGGYGLLLLKTWITAAVKKSAEEAAKATIEELNWPAELGRVLQKTRGVERQELRFKSYGTLWSKLRPLAIYDIKVNKVINKDVVGSLSEELTVWYFSECGGLLLTPQARDFYFALQNLLRATFKVSEGWVAERSEETEGAERAIFEAVLKKEGTDKAISALQYVKQLDVPADWQKEAATRGRDWNEGINKVAKAWNRLDKGQRFATLQQVGSILRTCLVNDLESRVR